MATNFEVYKGAILGYVEEYASFPAFVNGKLVTCVSGDCQQCIFRSPNCFAKRVEWLYAEHIEQPKLTKRERAFCEMVQTGWIARDKNNTLWWYCDEHEPVKDDDRWKRESKYVKNIKGCNEINNAWATFAFIKWEDEKPWAVEDLLKLEVKEDA